MDRTSYKSCSFITELVENRDKLYSIYNGQDKVVEKHDPIKFLKCQSVGQKWSFNNWLLFEEAREQWRDQTSSSKTSKG